MTMINQLVDADSSCSSSTTSSKLFDFSSYEYHYSTDEHYVSRKQLNFLPSFFSFAVFYADAASKQKKEQATSTFGLICQRLCTRVLRFALEPLFLLLIIVSFHSACFLLLQEQKVSRGSGILLSGFCQTKKVRGLI